jgi:hypothetical protein
VTGRAALRITKVREGEALNAISGMSLGFPRFKPHVLVLWLLKADSLIAWRSQHCLVPRHSLYFNIPLFLPIPLQFLSSSRLEVARIS